MKIRIIGFGFAGLACAYAAQKKGWEIELYEESPTAGGLLKTIHTNFGLIESAANGIINSERFEELARSIGLNLSYADKTRAKRFIFSNRPTRWPLKLSTTLRLILKLFVFKIRNLKSVNDQLKALKVESGMNLTDWCKSFLGSEYHGKEFSAKLLSPALGGVYGLSTDHLDAELVLSSILKRRIGKQNKNFTNGTVAPKEGMGEIFNKFIPFLASKNVNVFFNNKFIFDEPTFDGKCHYIIATHPKKASIILKGIDAELASKLDNIQHLSLVSVTLFFESSTNDLKGFGCLFPESQDFYSRGVLFNSDIFSDRSFSYQIRSETFIVSKPTIISDSDEHIFKSILKDRLKINGQKEAQPISYKITRWPNALPIYNHNLSELISQLKPKTNNIHLIGNYLGDLSLSKILDNAFELVDAIDKTENSYDKKMY